MSFSITRIKARQGAAIREDEGGKTMRLSDYYRAIHSPWLTTSAQTAKTKAIIELDDVPEFQIGQIVRVSFPDSAVMYGKCKSASGWISVKDAMPEKDGQYLALLDKTRLMVVPFAKRLEEVDHEEFAGRDEPGWFEWDTEWCGFYEVTGVTNWMPLPEPPEEVTGDG